jgi:chemotaxis protein MotB
MSRKKAKKENGGSGGGAPGWMVTYGDLMSLLLTFFVLIVSFSSIELRKFQKAMGSLKGALGVLPKEQSVTYQVEPIMPQLTDFQKRRIQKVISQMRNMIKSEGLQQDVALDATDNGIIIRIDSPVLFEVGEAALKPQAYKILDKVLELTQDWSNSIRVEGHTDNQPIHTAQYPSNWELSTARALSVLRFFLGHGHIEPQRLAAVGYGEYHPLVPNTTPQNRAINRRVEIYIENDRKVETLKENKF